jgi:hypothetical protein
MTTNESSHLPTGAHRQPDQLYAPNGKRIVAAKDWIPGNALILGATRNPDGSLEVEWEGTTTMCWDGQYTERIGGQRIFLDEDANEWRENQLTLGSEPKPVESAPAPDLADPWAGIPDCGLGEMPDSLPDEQPLHYRRMIAKRALMAGYDDTDAPEQCVTDLLGDLRHLCDALGLDFAELDRAADRHYAQEKARQSA